MLRRKWRLYLLAGLLTSALCGAADVSTETKTHVDPFASPAQSGVTDGGEATLASDEGLRQTAYRVVGISKTAAMAVAVLRMHDGAYQLVEVDDVFDGMTVVAIDDKRVTLKAERGTRYLFLSY